MKMKKEDPEAFEELRERYEDAVGRLDHSSSRQHDHWDNTNNRVINILWERLESIEPPQQTIYRHIVIGAALCVERLLSPDKGAERILNVKPREVDFKQFRKLYGLLISSMARIYESLNPELSSVIRDGYEGVAGSKLKGGPMPLSHDEGSDPDLSYVATEIWGDVVDIVGSEQGDTTLEAYPFIVLYLSVGSETFKNINNEIDLDAA